MQRRAKGDGDNEGMKTITNIADQLFRKVQPVDSAFGSETAETRTPAFCAIDCPGRCPLELHLRDGELALAEWHTPEDVPADYSRISLTGEMIDQFRLGNF